MSEEVERAVMSALAWLGPTWEERRDHFESRLKLDTYEGLLRGGLRVWARYSKNPWAPPTVRITLDFDAQIPDRGEAVDIKPKQQGFLTPFSDAFGGEPAVFRAGDVEVDNHYALVGSEEHRPTVQTIVHPLRRLRTNRGEHEGYVRIDRDRLRVVLDGLPSTQEACDPPLRAVAEIWRLVAKGPVDAIVPLDLAEAKHSRVVVPHRERKKRLYRVSTREPEEAKNCAEQMDAMAQYLNQKWGGGVEVDQSSKRITVTRFNAQWRLEWGRGDDATLAELTVLLFAPAPFVFDICHEDFRHQIGKLFGLEEVQVGIPQFDADYFLETNDGEALKNLVESARYRSRLDVLPLSSFRFENVPTKPNALKRLVLRIEQPWTSVGRQQQKAVELLEMTAEALGPAQTPSRPAVLEDLRQTVLAVVPEASEGAVAFTDAGAHLAVAFDRFVANFEIIAPDFEQGTVALRLTGRGAVSRHAFEVLPIGPRPPIESAPLPSTAHSAGFPITLARRFAVKGVGQSREVVENLERQIDILADAAGHANLAVRLNQGEISIFAGDIRWDLVPNLARHFVDLWKQMLAVAD